MENPKRYFYFFIISQLDIAAAVKKRIQQCIIDTRIIQFPVIDLNRYFYIFAIHQLHCLMDVKNNIIKQIVNVNKVLSDTNCHPRDKNITFYEEGHKYDLVHPTTKLILNPISVTTLIHTYFPHFDAEATICKMMLSRNWHNSQYFGMTMQQIKDKWEVNRDQAANLGTNMHANIEHYLNSQSPIDDSIEYRFFNQFWKDFRIQYPTFDIYRTEFLVWDENFRKGKALCGSIDCLLKDDKDNYIIVDWKRSKEIKFGNRFEKGYKPFDYMDNCNYNHYSLQLNIYRHILQTKYNMNVIYLMLVVLHPNQTGYQCIPVKLKNLGYVWNNL